MQHFFPKAIKWLEKLRESKEPFLVYAPISGEIIDLEAVPDRVFAEKIMGEGVAIQPLNDDILVAPFSGTLSKILPSNHAFSLITKQGLELWVHFGIDTIELKGKGFQRIAQEGQWINHNDPIIRVDWSVLQQEAKFTITPIIIANMDIVHHLTKQHGPVTAGETVIMQIWY